MEMFDRMRPAIMFLPVNICTMCVCVCWYDNNNDIIKLVKHHH